MLRRSSGSSAADGRGRLDAARILHALVIRWRARLARRLGLRRRAVFVERASRVTSHVTVERDGSLFFLPTRQKAGVDRFKKLEWKEERHLRRALAALDDAGVPVQRMTFVDVGAHIGTTTITAIREFGFESALAFEPAATNFRLLRANRAINGLDARIRTFNVALSDRSGSGELLLRPEIGSKHRLLGDGEIGAETVRVPLATLDGLVEAGSIDPDRASLLWIDVEGHELEVLRGASRLLERSVPIVMEFAPQRLARNGGVDLLRSLLAGRYTHVLDLRRRPGRELAVPPLEALSELAIRYEQGFTDVLLFRRPAVSRAGLKPPRAA